MKNTNFWAINEFNKKDARTASQIVDKNGTRICIIFWVLEILILSFYSFNRENNMPTFSNSFYYLAFAITMFIFMLSLVPQKEIRSLFWFSLIWGPSVGSVLILLFRIFKFYYYLNAKPFDFYGVPLLIAFSWSPAIIVFLYFMPKRAEWYIYPLYLGAFGMLGTFIGVFLHNAGLLKEIHWNEIFRMPVIITWFHFAAWHYNILKSRNDKMI